MSTRKSRMHDEIAQHGRQLQSIFPKTRSLDPVALSKKLHRLEAEAHRDATDWCNGDINESAWGSSSDSVLDRLDKILGFRAADINVFVNGDARGYALKIDDSVARNLSIHKDWGGYGIISPTFEGETGSRTRHRRQG